MKRKMKWAIQLSNGELIILDKPSDLVSLGSGKLVRVMHVV